MKKLLLLILIPSVAFGQSMQRSTKTSIRKMSSAMYGVSGLPWKAGTLYPEKAATVTHFYWRNGALKDSHNTWTQGGTVPQVSASGTAAPSAGPYSDTNFYSLPANTSGVDTTGDFWGCFAYTLTSIPAASAFIYFNGAYSTTGAGWDLDIRSNGDVSYETNAASYATTISTGVGLAKIGGIQSVCVGRTATLQCLKVDQNPIVCTAGAKQLADTGRATYIGKHVTAGGSFNSGYIYEGTVVNESPGDQTAMDALFSSVNERALRSAGLPDGSNVNFAIISDTHYNCDPQHLSLAYAREAVTQMSTSGWAPAVMIHPGDIIYEATSAQYATCLAAVNTAWTSGSAPHVYTLGNHDVHNASVDIASIRSAFPSDASSWLQSSQMYGSTNISGVHVVVLDTTYQVNETATHTGLNTGTDNVAGYMPADERTWLSTDLAASTLPVVVILHQGLGAWDPGWPASRLTNYTAVMTILETYKSKIAAVVNGHTHKPLRATVNGVNYFTCNSSYAPFVTFSGNNRGNHVQMSVNPLRREVRWGVWENDSVKGYSLVEDTIVTY